MERIHVIFVGGRKEAALDSIKELENGIPKEIIAVYSERTKQVWEGIKEKIKGVCDIKEEYEVDYYDINNLIKTINRIQGIYKNNKILLNITGLSKEGFIALIVYYGFMEKNLSKDVEIAMLQIGKKKIIFSPEIIFELGCPKKNGRRGNLKKRIMKVLLDNNGKMSLSELTKKLRLSKPTVSEAVSSMEVKKLIKKEIKGREVYVLLNRFMYDILSVLGGVKNEKSNNSYYRKWINK